MKRFKIKTMINTMHTINNYYYSQIIHSNKPAIPHNEKEANVHCGSAAAVFIPCKDQVKNMTT